MVQPSMERLPVLSYSELISTANVRSVGVVSADQTLAVTA
jgi:flagellar biosynthesis component FlhA